ncbi:hypothetical protein Q4512_11115 [Oceanihabitans sp. 2_MG-2023]|uniref:hypothetical protein n=1 Tax=Oceanihabitans sp. 2_MG-2023 TaxID=3062661 RepID=UPI0026E142A4|nr:hypothetical protein [Oceanihabitans sp. 2_MG-2023]MDO6597466.1 hypothetical protein [Oceanihabitans sp. 2_MG-2023]
MKKIYLVTLLLSYVMMFSQSDSKFQSKIDWTKMNNNEGVTFYQVQENFNTYWKGKSPERGKGYKPFKRWEDYMTPRVYPSGDMSLPTTTYDNYLKWQLAKANPFNRSSTTVTSNWTQLGPIGAANGPLPYTGTGAGRVNFVRFDPTNANNMYVGAPDGGLWNSTDGGTTWTTNTDFLAVIGCSDLAIDPTNTQIMYLATGDIEGNRNSLGILKSEDGGVTWNTTSLVFDPASYEEKLSKLLMDPNDPLKMIVASSYGAYYTTDGWDTYYSSTFSSGTPVLKDMEFKPGLLNAGTVYASGTEFYKSTDFGATWSLAGNGLPTSNVSRIALAVTPGNDSYVYAVIGKDSDQSYMGTYRSTDSGNNFTTMSTTPNLLGYDFDGSDSGGQAFYDLAIVASPTAPNTITVGGVNHWQSTDGGVNWSNKSVWNSGEIHADVHELVYKPGSSSIMYSSNDGGFYISTDNGDQWTDISGNLAIGQVVKLGLSSNNPFGIVAGEQDNGTILNDVSLNDWYGINGGDGGECFIDYTDDNIIYVQYVEGKYSRVEYPAETNTPIQSGLPTGIDFYSPFKMDPVNHLKLYSGGTPTLYTSVDQGNNWSALGTSPGTGSITDFVVAPSDPTVIYTVQMDAISKSTNSGGSFTDITGTLPTTVAFSSITVSNIDANKVWVTYSGYDSVNKVFKSTDGGVTWTNISAGLPNVPINTLVFRNAGIADEIYVGADIGVFIINNNVTSWQPFMTNLPNAAVRDLEIFYPTNKLRAGTYGRGVWESDLNTQTLGIEEIINVNSNSAVLISSDENEQLQIKSSLHNIDKVVIYDVLGKRIFKKEGINATIFKDNSITKSQRVLFVRTSLSDGSISINKVLF